MLFALLLACAPSPAPLASTASTASTGTPAGTAAGTGTTFAAGPAIVVFETLGVTDGDFCRVADLAPNEVPLAVHIRYEATGYAEPVTWRWPDGGVTVSGTCDTLGPAAVFVVIIGRT